MRVAVRGKDGRPKVARFSIEGPASYARSGEKKG